MIDDLVTWLRAQLDADEQWALAANRPYQYAAEGARAPQSGVHWRWVAGDDWRTATVDPVLDDLVHGEDDDYRVWLATVEEWPTNDGIDSRMPRTYLDAEEVDASAAGHIVRHDPARVLAEIEAKRRILQQAWTGIEDLAINIESIRAGDDCGARDLRDEIIKLLALPYADREGYRGEWRP